MKRRIFSTLLMFSFLFSLALYGKEGSAKISPVKPKAGDEITVTFDASKTELAKSEKIEMTVSLFTDKIDEMISVDMQKNGKVWSGKFKTNTSTEFAAFYFSEGEKEDKNDGKGYLVNFYNPAGKILKGSVAGNVLSKNSWGYYTGVDRDYEGSVKGFNAMFKTYPELKDKYLVEYYTCLNGADKAKGKLEVPKAIAALEAKANLTEDDYTKLASLCGIIKDTKKRDDIQKIIAEKFPTSSAAKGLKYTEISKEKDMTKKIELAAAFEKLFPGDPYVGYIYGGIVYALAKESKFAEAKSIIDKYGSSIQLYYLNNFVSSVIKANKEIDLAESTAKTIIDNAKKGMDEPIAKKPKTVTQKSWEENKKSTYGSALLIYADVLAAKGKKEEALKTYEEGVSLAPLEEPNPDQTEKYAKLLMAVNQNDKAYKITEEAISKNQSSDGIKELYKKLYAIKNGNETGLEPQLEKLTAAGKKYTIDEIKKKMLDKPAPKFILTDLDGKKVSLDDFKGKTVILDFWATWCGPCISSFPGMQKAVTKFEKDKNVKFLFINAWQSEDDKKQNAQDFITKNKYTFHVLLDEQDKVITSYKVSGIPTKFILDKKGKIRFQSIGFSGDTDGLVEELSLMIDLIR